MALPWVVVAMPAAAVVEGTSVLLVPSVPSSVCWAADRIQQHYLGLTSFPLIPFHYLEATQASATWQVSTSGCQSAFAVSEERVTS